MQRKIEILLGSTCLLYATASLPLLGLFPFLKVFKENIHGFEIVVGRESQYFQ